jgi:pimeloyl-ACP methyl ester carboxylesterase
MPHVTSGRSRIYYEVHGEGPPLVLMHGVGGNHVSWFNQVPEFSRHFRTVILDHRGFGLSDDHEGAGRSAMVDDLCVVLAELGIERTRLVAQSMSGGVAVNFTRRSPERVEALVLADTVVGFELPPDLTARLQAMSAAGQHLSTVERVFGSTFLTSDPAQVFLYRQISSFNRYNARNITGAFPLQAPATLSAQGVPILFLAGAEERRFPVEVIRGVQSLVAGSTYLEVPRAGHSVYFEQPEAFNEAVLGFMSATG